MRVFIASPPEGLTWQLRHAALVAGLEGAGCDVSQAVRRRGTFALERRVKDVDVAVVFARQSAPASARFVVRDIAHFGDAGAPADLVVRAGSVDEPRRETPPVVAAPTMVDTDLFAPPLRPRPGDALPRLGWILGTEGAEEISPGGTPAALAALRALLGRLGHHVRYALDVSGSGVRIRVPGVMVRHRPAPSLEELPEILHSVDALLVTPGRDARASALVAAAAGVVPVLLDTAESRHEPARFPDLGPRCEDADTFVRQAVELLRDPEVRAERSVRARARVVGERRLNALAPRLGEQLVALASASSEPESGSPGSARD